MRALLLKDNDDIESVDIFSVEDIEKEVGGEAGMCSTGIDTDGYDCRILFAYNSDYFAYGMIDDKPLRFTVNKNASIIHRRLVSGVALVFKVKLFKFDTEDEELIEPLTEKDIEHIKQYVENQRISHISKSESINSEL